MPGSRRFARDEFINPLQLLKFRGDRSAHQSEKPVIYVITLLWLYHALLAMSQVGTNILKSVALAFLARPQNMI